MTEAEATNIAEALGARPWQPYPGLWLVLVHRADGCLVVLDRGGVREYANCEALEAAEPSAFIALREEADP